MKNIDLYKIARINFCVIFFIFFACNKSSQNLDNSITKAYDKLYNKAQNWLKENKSETNYIVFGIEKQAFKARLDFVLENRKN